MQYNTVHLLNICASIIYDIPITNMLKRKLAQLSAQQSSLADDTSKINQSAVTPTTNQHKHTKHDNVNKTTINQKDTAPTKQIDKYVSYTV